MLYAPFRPARVCQSKGFFSMLYAESMLCAPARGTHPPRGRTDESTRADTRAKPRQRRSLF
jgi:hypothetical protein